MLARAARTAEILGVTVLVALVAIWAARWVGTTNERERAQLAVKDSVAHRLALATRHQRIASDSVIEKLSRKSRIVDNIARDVEKTAIPVHIALDSAAAVLADSTAELSRVRAALGQLATTTAPLRESALLLAAQVDSLLAVQEEATAQWMRERAVADSALAAMTASRDAWRDKARPPLLRRLLGIACEGGLTAGGTALGAIGGQPVLGAIGGFAVGTAACP